jgi:hypothetical protein
MKPNKLIALGAVSLLVGCGGGDPSDERIIKVPSPSSVAQNSVRKNEDSGSPGSRSLSGAAQMSQNISSGFGEAQEQLAAAQQRRDQEEKQKLQHEAEQKALDRAHEAMMLDKKNAAEDKQSVMRLFSDAMAASLMLKMTNPDPCVNQSFIDGLSGLGKALGDGLAATKKGLNDREEVDEDIKPIASLVEVGPPMIPVAPISQPIPSAAPVMTPAPAAASTQTLVIQTDPQAPAALLPVQASSPMTQAFDYGAPILLETPSQ